MPPSPASSRVPLPPPRSVALRNNSPTSQLLYNLLYVAGLLLSFGMVFFGPYIFYRWAIKWWGHPDTTVFIAGYTLFITLFAMLTGARWVVLYILIFLEERRRKTIPHPDQIVHWPFVSVFVPAYNESETIVPALQSLLNLDYPNFEVIVVDDGSKDDTYQNALPWAGQYPFGEVRVFRKPNGGKWTAHNFAYQQSRGEYILCLDADSRLEPQALKLSMRHMVDPSVHAVGGSVRVRNRINLLTACQALDYTLANGLLRGPQSYNGSVLIVPGAIGLFRRNAFAAVAARFGGTVNPNKPGEVAGPFSGDTFGEDFDMSMGILVLGGKIVYEPFAMSMTKAPDNVFAFVSQRYRWSRGNLQVLFKYFRKIRKEPWLWHRRLRNWVIGSFGYEFVILMMFYLSVPVVGALILTGVVTLPELLLGYLGVHLFHRLAYSLLVIRMHEENLLLLLTMPFFELYSMFLVSGAFLIAVYDELRGSRMSW